MKIQYLSRFNRITKELGLENFGQIREFYRNEKVGNESLFETVNRYYREYLGVFNDYK